MIRAHDLCSQIFCIGVLVASAFVLWSIDKVEDYIDKGHSDDYFYRYGFRYAYGYRYGSRRVEFQYEDVSGYRGAAEWMICIASLSIIFHPAMLLFRYLCCRERVRSLFTAFSYVVSNMTGSVNTGHICSNSACLKNGTLLDHRIQ